ncbi:cell wall protein DAN4-like [Gambusia affinis]|uniref:cell wall protein DAN4-like n=1 Tax=Gambusia affinis TaxID=33528 RepID=UPI001CDD1BF7|nr:cell wall protein DAN4-like [Gambusia affinis]XP_043960954.1 cell wall protein DAN4-like [Gambusia affinis]
MHTTMRPQRLRINPKDEAAHFVSLSQDKDGFSVQYINSFKGRGVFSTCHFQTGAFLLEYRGDVINSKEYENRVKIYHDAMKVFMFEFRHNGKKLCVDAAREDGSLGRLVNDDHLIPNSKMKTITVNGKPHLCLFAIKDINPGEEITYNYGNAEWPWRVKVSAHPDKTVGEEPMGSLSSSLEPQVSAHPDKTVGEEPMGSLSSSLEPQVSAHPDKTVGEEPMGSLSSSLEPQVSAHPDNTVGEEPMGSLCSSLEPQVSAHPDITVGEEPMGSLSSSLEPQVSAHPDKTVGEEPMGSLSSSLEPQVSAHPDNTVGEEPMGSLSSSLEPQVSAHPDNTVREEPMGSLCSSLEPQVSAHPDITVGEEPMGSLSSSLEPQVSAHPDKTVGEEPMGSLSSSLEPQVSAHPDKTVGEEPMGSLSSSLEPQVSAHPDNTVGEEPMGSLCSSLGPQKCNHVVLRSSFSSIEKCTHCLGPFVALKWNGLKCKDCSSIWHNICYEKIQRTDFSPSSWVSDESSSADDLSDKEYIPDSVSYSESSVELSIDDSNHFKRTILDPCFSASLPDCQKSDGAENDLAEGLISESEDRAKKVVQKQMKRSSKNKKTVDVQTEGRPVEPLTRSEAVESIQSTSISSSRDKKNYCFVCGKPQSKIARHLKVHEKTNAEVAQALAQPKASKLRKKILGQLRNKGNSTHNKEVYKSGSGLLKIKRKPKLKYNINQYVHCMFCQGLYLRNHLWRHARKCKSKPRTTDETGPKRVLSLALMVDSGLCQQISQGVFKLLTVMKDDEVSAAVRSDFYILQLAQSFFNKHGQDPSKHEYIRQKIREVGRLLLILRNEFSIYNIEDAVRPSNFHVLVQAVKRVSGFDEDSHSYKTPSLAL